MRSRCRSAPSTARPAARPAAPPAAAAAAPPSLALGIEKLVGQGLRLVVAGLRREVCGEVPARHELVRLEEDDALGVRPGRKRLHLLEERRCDELADKLHAPLDLAHDPCAGLAQLALAGGVGQLEPRLRHLGVPGPGVGGSGVAGPGIGSGSGVAGPGAVGSGVAGPGVGSGSGVAGLGVVGVDHVRARHRWRCRGGAGEGLEWAAGEHVCGPAADMAERGAVRGRGECLEGYRVPADCARGLRPCQRPGQAEGGSGRSTRLAAHRAPIWGHCRPRSPQHPPTPPKVSPNSVEPP